MCRLFILYFILVMIPEVKICVSCERESLCEEKLVRSKNASTLLPAIGNLSRSAIITSSNLLLIR